MLLRRISSHVRNENWFAVFIDFLVVVVGLFIGFQIDTWWEGRKDARLEGAYLAEIREDFDANKLALSSSIGGTEENILSMIALHEQSSLSTPTMSVSELNEKFSLVQSMPTFIAIRRTYSNLTGSGDLKFIQNRELKNALAEYYAGADLIVLIQQTHEMELVQTFQPYVIDNLDYSAVHFSRMDEFPLPPPVDEASILEVLNTRKFRNMLAQKWTISTDLLSQYRAQLELTDNIIALLEKGCLSPYLSEGCEVPVQQEGA